VGPGPGRRSDPLSPPRRCRRASPSRTGTSHGSARAFGEDRGPVRRQDRGADTPGEAQGPPRGAGRAQSGGGRRRLARGGRPRGACAVPRRREVPRARHPRAPVDRPPGATAAARPAGRGWDAGRGGRAVPRPGLRPRARGRALSDRVPARAGRPRAEALAPVPATGPPAAASVGDGLGGRASPRQARPAPGARLGAGPRCGGGRSERAEPRIVDGAGRAPRLHDPRAGRRARGGRGRGRLPRDAAAHRAQPADDPT